VNKIDTGFACGRHYLSVNGFVVAMEGDLCRDSTLPGTHWSEELLKSVVNDTQSKMEKRLMKKRNAAGSFSSLSAIDAEATYRAQKQKDQDDHDVWVAERFKETYAIVEANANETQNLWADWAIENTWRLPDPRNQRKFVHWEQVTRGHYQQVGQFRINKDIMPVVLSLFWARLRTEKTGPGRLVMFWDMTSQVSDSRMAEKFFKKNLPKGIINTNAANFHNVTLSLGRP
jgi:hypothetical protein